MALSDRERRTLSDYMRVGVERTTERLEKMTRSKWGIMSSCVKEVTAVRLLKDSFQSETQCVGAYFHASSMVPLEFLIMFPEDGAEALAKAVTSPYAERMKQFSDLVSLTIGEVSNFLAQSVLSVIADEFNVMIILKTPEVILGKEIELLELALRRYDGREDTLLFNQVDIYSQDLEAHCSMVILANSDMIHNLVKTASHRG